MLMLIKGHSPSQLNWLVRVTTDTRRLFVLRWVTTLLVSSFTAAKLSSMWRQMTGHSAIQSQIPVRSFSTISFVITFITFSKLKKVQLKSVWLCWPVVGAPVADDNLRVVVAGDVRGLAEHADDAVAPGQERLEQRVLLDPVAARVPGVEHQDVAGAGAGDTGEAQCHLHSQYF